MTLGSIARDAIASWSTQRHLAATGWAASAAIIVARDGSWPWIVVRLAVVASLFTALLATGSTGRGRTATALAVGTIGLVIGLGIGVSHLVRGSELVLAIAGSLSLLCGIALLVRGTRQIVAGRGRTTQVAGTIGVSICVILVAFVCAPAVMATNVPRTRLGHQTPTSLGFGFEDVHYETSDGARIGAWYIPSSNGAAVVLRHGAGSTRSDTLQQAIVLARQGYGVLATDARGHGDSGGRAMDFGWYGDIDIAAAVTFLTFRPDVDPLRIGVVGLSMGGEEAIGAAAADERIRVVVAEGATGRTGADFTWFSEAYGVRGAVQEGLEWARFELTDLLTDASKPRTLTEAVERARPTPFLLIVAGKVPDEQHAADHLLRNAADNVTVWTVENAGHTAGLGTDPVEWERRVTEFLDDAIGATSG